MGTSSDGTASPRSCCKAHSKGREDEDGLQRCGWATSRTGNDYPLSLLMTSFNDEGWWPKRPFEHPNDRLVQGIDGRRWRWGWWIIKRIVVIRFWEIEDKPGGITMLLSGAGSPTLSLLAFGYTPWPQSGSQTVWDQLDLNQGHRQCDAPSFPQFINCSTPITGISFPLSRFAPIFSTGARYCQVCPFLSVDPYLMQIVWHVPSSAPCVGRELTR